jgi:hypothetical protein
MQVPDLSAFFTPFRLQSWEEEQISRPEASALGNAKLFFESLGKSAEKNPSRLDPFQALMPCTSTSVKWVARGLLLATASEANLPEHHHRAAALQMLSRPNCGRSVENWKRNATVSSFLLLPTSEARPTLLGRRLPGPFGEQHCSAADTLPSNVSNSSTQQSAPRSFPILPVSKQSWSQVTSWSLPHPALEINHAPPRHCF